MIEIPGILDRQVSRRSWMQWSSYGVLAAAMNQARVSATESRSPGNIRSCILLTLYGGPSQLDTWDMKPDASPEVRGEYRPIQTCVPGTVVCEHLAACSQVVDRMAIVRSMHHEVTNHNSAMYLALVGRPPSSNDPVLPATRARDFPNHGSTLSYLTATGHLPRTANPLTNVALPHVMHNVVDLPGQNAGFLGGSYDPMQINSDPNLPNFQVRNLSLPPEVNSDRMAARKTLLRQLDKPIGAAADGSDLIDYQQRAFDLMRSDTVRNAFRMNREPDRVRKRYGRHKLGQSLLLARRLVESGVRFINVHDGVRNGQNVNWDSHATLFPRHRQLLEPLDQGLSALILDLEQRGLLNSTLIVVMGEFGRSPRINANAGRDHWPNCYSVLLAGGGVSGGALYGSSDSMGAYPESNATTPGDLAATIFWRFGVDHRREFTDLLNRPFPLAAGNALRELFSRVEP